MSSLFWPSHLAQSVSHPMSEDLSVALEKARQRLEKVKLSVPASPTPVSKETGGAAESPPSRSSAGQALSHCVVTQASFIGESIYTILKR